MSLLKKENPLFNIAGDDDFAALALSTFRYQHAQNRVYRAWCDYLKVNVNQVGSLHAIPFLPIEAFKQHRVICGTNPEADVVFRSSRTTGAVASEHHVRDLDLYEQSFVEGFRQFYGDPAEYCFIALLPSYLERNDSSLIYMVNHLAELSGHPQNGFFKGNEEQLPELISTLSDSPQKVMLIGVSYALIDLADRGVRPGPNFIIMETGGMKGRRKEMLKSELHALLRERLHAEKIHSEYGMTELLSQAYSPGDQLFTAPPWMKFFIRETTDALSHKSDGRTGGISVIDLANSESCSFIATKDLGRMHGDGRLELMGRFDHSDIRGCNLLMDGF